MRAAWKRSAIWLAAAAVSALFTIYNRLSNGLALNHPSHVLYAMLPAAIYGVLLWTGTATSRWVLATALLGAAATPPLLPTALMALPCLASLLPTPPASLVEARVAGAGDLAILLRIILPNAAPGLLYGVLICLAPMSPAWQVLAAALPLMARI